MLHGQYYSEAATLELCLRPIRSKLSDQLDHSDEDAPVCPLVSVTARTVTIIAQTRTTKLKPQSPKNSLNVLGFEIRIGYAEMLCTVVIQLSISGHQQSRHLLDSLVLR